MSFDTRFIPFDEATRNAVRDTRRIGGTAIVFNQPTVIAEGLVEEIGPSAVDRLLAGTAPLRLLAEHDDRRLLATRHAGTLRIAKTPTALTFEADIPRTSLGDEVLELVARGDYAGASFRFHIPSAKYEWRREGAHRIGRLVDANISEVSVVSVPAYSSTHVAIRASYEAWQRAGFPTKYANLRFPSLT